MAIKVLDISSTSKKLAADEEAKFHSIVKHPVFVRMNQEFSDDSNKYLVLEFCEKGELFSLLKKKGRLSEEESLAIVGKLLEGLEFLQKSNLVHRDLKLGNIFLTQKLTPKIGDFGLMMHSGDHKKTPESVKAGSSTSRAMLSCSKGKSQTSSNFFPKKVFGEGQVSSTSKFRSSAKNSFIHDDSNEREACTLFRPSDKQKKTSSSIKPASSKNSPRIVGTPNYVAPEIITEGEYSHKSDVWALGCVAYALVFGSLPFEGDSTEKTFENILQNQPKRQGKISSHYREMLSQMLNSDVKARKTAKQLLDWLSKRSSNNDLPAKERDIKPVISESKVPVVDFLRPVRSKFELNRLLKADLGLGNENSKLAPESTFSLSKNGKNSKSQTLRPKIVEDADAKRGAQLESYFFGGNGKIFVEKRGDSDQFNAKLKSTNGGNSAQIFEKGLIFKESCFAGRKKLETLIELNLKGKTESTMATTDDMVNSVSGSSNLFQKK